MTLQTVRPIERATLQIAEAKSCTNVADEASIYLLVNGGGTPQTDADLLNAEQVVNPPEEES